MLDVLAVEGPMEKTIPPMVKGQLPVFLERTQNAHLGNFLPLGTTPNDGGSVITMAKTGQPDNLVFLMADDSAGRWGGRRRTASPMS